MMPCKFTDLAGQEATLDLDEVVDVVDGWSQRRDGWQAFIVFDPKSRRLIELQSTTPDVRGNSVSEAEEVSVDYVRDTFGLTEIQLAALRGKPRLWSFVKRRC
jgi:hypothetical protein